MSIDIDIISEMSNSDFLELVLKCINFLSYANTNRYYIQEARFGNT